MLVSEHPDYAANGARVLRFLPRVGRLEHSERSTGSQGTRNWATPGRLDEDQNQPHDYSQDRHPRQGQRCEHQPSPSGTGRDHTESPQ